MPDEIPLASTELEKPPEVDKEEEKRAHRHHLLWIAIPILWVGFRMSLPYLTTQVPSEEKAMRQHLQAIANNPRSADANEAEQAFYKYVSLRGIDDFTGIAITPYERHDVSLSQVQIEFDSRIGASTACAVMTPMPDAKVALFYDGPCVEDVTEREVLDRLSDAK